MSSGKKERRHFASPRVTARIKVFIDSLPHAAFHTVNISQSGILLQSSTQMLVDDFVKLKISLPRNQSLDSISGRVARVYEESPFYLIGIQLLEISADDQEKWLEYVSKIEDLSVMSQTPSTTAQFLQQRKLAGKNTRKIVIRFESSEKLSSFFHNKLQDDRLFIEAPTFKTPGDEVDIILVHPENEEKFILRAEISTSQSVLGNPTWAQKGLTLILQNYDDEEKEKLNSFVTSN